MEKSIDKIFPGRINFMGVNFLQSETSKSLLVESLFQPFDLSAENGIFWRKSMMVDSLGWADAFWAFRSQYPYGFYPAGTKMTRKLFKWQVIRYSWCINHTWNDSLKLRGIRWVSWLMPTRRYPKEYEKFTSFVIY